MNNSNVFNIYFNFETNFLENENLFEKTGVLFLKPLRLKTHHFHSKLLSEATAKIKIYKQNGDNKMDLSTTKSGVLPQ